jgi:hypothetical protein
MVVVVMVIIMVVVMVMVAATHWAYCGYTTLHCKSNA